jgi:N6-L-threonylcarbamoyladenine synthase
MSFSGLKTAALRARDALLARDGGLRESARADLCAGFQAAVADVLAEKSARALRLHPEATAFAAAGGVAANRAIRAALLRVAEEAGLPFAAPPLPLCTDNAAMIAWAAIERARAGLLPGPVTARPRWPRDEAAPPLVGAGRRGAKA